MEGTIVFRIDVLLAKRKMSVTELAERVGITLAGILPGGGGGGTGR